MSTNDDSTPDEPDDVAPTDGAPGRGSSTPSQSDSREDRVRSGYVGQGGSSRTPGDRDASGDAPGSPSGRDGGQDPHRRPRPGGAGRARPERGRTSTPGRPAPGQGRGGGQGAGTARDRSRRPGPLVMTLSILLGVALLIGVLSQTWTEVLWFSQLGFARTVWTRWGTCIALFLGGFLIMSASVMVGMVRAYTTREVFAPTDEASRNLESYRATIEPARRLLTWGIPIALGLIGGAGDLTPHWREVLLALNAQSFGTADPQFGLDVSFYVFILPALSLLNGFLMRVVIFAGVASVVVHYLYGGISVTRNPHFTRAARRHLTIVLALFCLLTALRYWLQRYESLYASDSSKFDGASYTDVNASIPAYAILAAISVAIAVMFLAALRTSSWRLPVTGVVVMVVSTLLVGAAYPVVVQKFVVEPNAQREEAAYIDRNIRATRTAYGLDDIQETSYSATTTAQAGQLKADAESTTSIRLLDPNLVSPTFRQLQQNKQYYSFAPTLNVDRYQVDGKGRDTVIAVRELNLDGIGDNRSWVNEHTVYTHGYGVVTAYGNTVASGGYPSFWEGGIPSTGDLGSYEPRIYFGKSSPSYSIVGGDDGGTPRELDYPDDSADSDQVNTTFTGNGGPDVGNPFNRLLYAVKFREMNILFSQEVRDGSQILYDRDPAHRVAKVAPWLTLDGNPYPAVVDDDDDPATPKRVKWILDGYTTSNSYPYSQHQSLEDSASDATHAAGLLGAPKKSNYVRNSVKAVVDAYDGSVTLYQWDDQDPVLRAWESIFPGAVTPMSQMSADLMAHMRYPEDLFKVQRTVLAKYHVTDPAEFYSESDFWKVPDDPAKDGNSPQAPYYLTLKMPDQQVAAFSLSSVYIIGGNTDRNVLTGFLAVDSETSPGTGVPGQRNPDYGRLRLLELPRSLSIAGPGQVQNTFNSDPTASQTLNLLSQQGSQVIKGNLLTLPVGGGLLYVQPVYVQSSTGTQYPLLRKVLVSFGDKVGFADTLREALDQVFGGDSGATTGEQVVDGDAGAANGTSTTPQDPGATPASPTPGATAAPTSQPSASTSPTSGTGDPQTDLNTALADAKSAMTDADTAMKAGDWAAYGNAQKRLTDAINRAVDAQSRMG